LLFFFACLAFFLMIPSAFSTPFTRALPNRWADGTVQYIEVKSSATEDLLSFYISPNELKAASKFNSQYTIARVFGCPEPSCRPAAPAARSAALIAGQLPESVAPHNMAIAPGRLARMSQQQLADMKGRSGHTRVLFLQDPIELMKRKVVKLKMQL
jgi:hypothetical protein